jgi:hypothetical protein
MARRTFRRGAGRLGGGLRATFGAVLRAFARPAAGALFLPLDFLDFDVAAFAMMPALPPVVLLSIDSPADRQGKAALRNDIENSRFKPIVFCVIG